MDIVAPQEFQHTTLDRYPDYVTGLTLIDEEPGFTGIYLRDANGGLWPARTVSHSPPEHHQSVLDSWVADPRYCGRIDDRRAIKA